MSSCSTWDLNPESELQCAEESHSAAGGGGAAESGLFGAQPPVYGHLVSSCSTWDLNPESELQ